MRSPARNTWRGRAGCHPEVAAPARTSTRPETSTTTVALVGEGAVGDGARIGALAEGTTEVSLEIGGRPFTQEPQKYHAKSLAVLRARYAAVADRGALDPVLAASGCLRFLAG